MKTKFKSLLILALLAVSFSAFQLSAFSQSTNPPTLGMTVATTLSLRNPAIQQTNTFTVSLGDGMRTENNATYQATVLHGLYAVKENLSLGLRTEFDTLGTGGQTIAGISIGSELRYESDNLYASFIAGYHRDVEKNTRAAEFGIGLGAYMTQSFSVATEFLMTHNGRSKNALDRAVVVTANYTF